MPLDSTHPTRIAPRQARLRLGEWLPVACDSSSLSRLSTGKKSTRTKQCFPRQAASSNLVQDKDATRNDQIVKDLATTGRLSPMDSGGIGRNRCRRNPLLSASVLAEAQRPQTASHWRLVSARVSRASLAGRK
jgi:hypothetical protein